MGKELELAFPLHIRIVDAAGLNVASQKDNYKPDPYVFIRLVDKTAADDERATVPGGKIDQEAIKGMAKKRPGYRSTPLKTNALSQTSTPRWAQTLSYMKLPSPWNEEVEGLTLLIEVWDQQKYGFDGMLGRSFVSLNELTPGATKVLKLKLEDGVEGDGAFLNVSLYRNSKGERGLREANEEQPASNDASLMVVAKALKGVMDRQMVKGYSPGDITIGLKYFRRAKIRERKENAKPIDEKRFITTPEQLSNALYWLKVTCGTYASSLANVAEKSFGSIVESEVLEACWVSAPCKPAYMVARDVQSKSLVLGVRGTSNVSDALTDAAAATDIFVNNHQAHMGIASGAKYLAQKFEPVLRMLLAEHPDHSIVCVGHSLGGASAAMVATLLKPTFPNIHAYCYAPAASVVPALGVEMDDYVTSFILGDDAVPRASTRNLYAMRAELFSYKWGPEAKADFAKTKFGALLGSVDAKTASTRQAVGSQINKAKGGIKGGFKKLGAKMPKRGSSTDKDKAESDDVAPVAGDDVAPSKQAFEYPVLVPPGQLFHICCKNGDSGSSDFCMVNAPQSEFEHMIVSAFMLDQHRTDSYVAALQEIIDSI